MSALDLLNEIKGDITPDNPTDDVTLTPTPTVSVALEALTAKAPDVDKQMTLHTLIDSVRSSERVSKELALEVFTMLPPMVSLSSPQNYLTAAPSSYNKTFVLDKIAPFDNREEVRSFMNSLLNEIVAVEGIAFQLKQITTTYQSLVKEDLERLEKCVPMVVYPGGKFNLLADHIERIAEVNDSLYNYEPYEGALSEKYRTLMYSKGYALLKERTGHGNSEMSVVDILNYLRNVSHYYEEIEKNVARLIDNLSSFAKGTGTKYVIEDAINFMRNLPVDQILFEGKDCVAEQVLALIKFLK